MLGSTDESWRATTWLVICYDRSASISLHLLPRYLRITGTFASPLDDPLDLISNALMSNKYVQTDDH